MRTYVILCWRLILVIDLKTAKIRRKKIRDSWYYTSPQCSCPLRALRRARYICMQREVCVSVVVLNPCSENDFRYLDLWYFLLFLRSVLNDADRIMLFAVARHRLLGQVSKFIVQGGGRIRDQLIIPRISPTYSPAFWPNGCVEMLSESFRFHSSSNQPRISEDAAPLHGIRVLDMTRYKALGLVSHLFNRKSSSYGLNFNGNNWCHWARGGGLPVF